MIKNVNFEFTTHPYFLFYTYSLKEMHSTVVCCWNFVLCLFNTMDFFLNGSTPVVIYLFIF